MLCLLLCYYVFIFFYYLLLLPTRQNVNTTAGIGARGHIQAATHMLRTQERS